MDYEIETLSNGKNIAIVSLYAGNAPLATFDYRDTYAQYAFHRMMFALTRDRDDVKVYDRDKGLFIQGVAGETVGQPMYQYSDGSIQPLRSIDALNAELAAVQA